MLQEVYKPLKGEVAMENAVFAEDKKQESPLPCTFVIKVKYADRTTIQGYIQWIEQGKTVAFRSYMELLYLTQEALRKSKNVLTNFRSWEN
jgi:hypothetical protein